MNETQFLSHIEIAQFFLDNFDIIGLFDEVKSIKEYFGEKLIDLADDPTQNFIEKTLSLTLPVQEGHKIYNFRFHENSNIWGILELNFIGTLKNVRCQIFGDGTNANNYELDEINKSLTSYFTRRFGEPREIKPSPVYVEGLSALQWDWPPGAKYIVLRTSKCQSEIRNYVSFAITRMGL